MPRSFPARRHVDREATASFVIVAPEDSVTDFVQNTVCLFKVPA